MFILLWQNANAQDGHWEGRGDLDRDLAWAELCQQNMCCAWRILTSFLLWGCGAEPELWEGTLEAGSTLQDMGEIFPYSAPSCEGRCLGGSWKHLIPKTCELGVDIRAGMQLCKGHSDQDRHIRSTACSFGAKREVSLETSWPGWLPVPTSYAASILSCVCRRPLWQLPALKNAGGWVWPQAREPVFPVSLQSFCRSHIHE